MLDYRFMLCLPGRKFAQSVIESLLMTHAPGTASPSTTSYNMTAPSYFAMTHIAFSAGCNICFDMLYEHHLLP